MTKQELKTLIQGALTGAKVENFSTEDCNKAAIKGLLEYYGLSEDASYKELKRCNFDVIEEVIDEVLPKQLENIMGGWAVIKQYARNEEVVYKTKNLGKRRALLSIVPGARAGIYKARRLDGRNVSISVRTITAGVMVQLEDILLGTASLGELLTNILDGVQYQIYKDVVSALRTIKTYAPAANQVSAAGLDAKSMDDLIRVVSAYGTPMIVCFHSFATQFNNMINVAGANPNFPIADIEEIRSKGFVTVFHGTPVVEVPNYIVDENTNADWMFSEADAFVLPVEEKPVIVAMQGDGYIQENAHALGGSEMNYHKMMGTAILAYNNLGIYHDTQIAENEGSQVI